MSAKLEKWCDMCAKRLDFSEGIVTMSVVEVEGHAPVLNREYGICAACAEKLRVFLDTQKTASDTKWNRTDPKALDVVL